MDYSYKDSGEYRPSDKNTGITALTFLLMGVSIGAIVALFIAPKSGKQLRKVARRKYEDARESAADAWDNREEWAEVARKKVEPMIRKMRRD